MGFGWNDIYVFTLLYYLFCSGASSFGNALTRGGRGTTVAPGPAATLAGPTPFAVLGGMFDDILAESKEKADASPDADAV